MKKAYFVSYDLKKPGRDYSGLYSALKDLGKWWHYLDSSWLICTSETPEKILSRIKSSIDKGDRVLIIEVRDNCEGWLPKEAWAWIHNHVPPP